MFGLGAGEVIVILGLALIVLGPQKLPEVARQLARWMGELRRASDEVRRNFDEATREVTRDVPMNLPALMQAPPVETPAGPVAADKSSEILPTPAGPVAADVPVSAPADPSTLSGSDKATALADAPAPPKSNDPEPHV